MSCHLCCVPAQQSSLQLNPKQAMNGATASVSPGTSVVCLNAPPIAPAPAPPTPQPARRAQHTHQVDKKQHNTGTACSSSSCSVLQGHCHSQHASEKLLWWPVDHITIQGRRLAVGESCYVITGHCVLCGIDDDLDMVECTRCGRFTHFSCTFPNLTSTPAVSCSSNPCNKHVHIVLLTELLPYINQFAPVFLSYHQAQ